MDYVSEYGKIMQKLRKLKALDGTRIRLLKSISEEALQSNLGENAQCIFELDPADKISRSNSNNVTSETKDNSRYNTAETSIQNLELNLSLLLASSILSYDEMMKCVQSIDNGPLIKEIEELLSTSECSQTQSSSENATRIDLSTYLEEYLNDIHFREVQTQWDHHQLSSNNPHITSQDQTVEESLNQLRSSHELILNKMIDTCKDKCPYQINIK